jgi:hypothetical protein
MTVDDAASLLLISNSRTVAWEKAKLLTSTFCRLSLVAEFPTAAASLADDEETLRLFHAVKARQRPALLNMVEQHA